MSRTSTGFVPEINCFATFLTNQYLEGRDWTGRGSNMMNTANGNQMRGQSVGDSPGAFNTLKDNQKAVNKVDNRIAGI